MAERQPLKRLLPTFLLSIIWSTLVFFQILWKVIIKGPSKVFYVEKRVNRPEVLDDPSFGVHGFARLKRLKLHYVAKGAESKPLMLMIHGFPEFWYSWRHQLKEFGGDYRAVAIDMRGYGESDKPGSIADYTIDSLIQDIKELIPALGYEKCVLMAHDWGGAVAWSFTQMYPSMVDKLVICNCPHGLAFQKHIQSDWKQFLMSWYMLFFQMPFLPEVMLRSEDLRFLDAAFTGKKMGAKPGKFTAEDIDMYKYTFQEKGALTAPVNFYRAALQYKSSLQYPSKKVQVPTLMVWGTGDKALSQKLAETSGDYAEDYRVRYVEGASHWVQQEEPEIVNKYICQFLSSEEK